MRTQSASKRNATVLVVKKMARRNTTVFIIASDRLKRWREISGPIRTKVFTMISQRERKVQASKLLEAGENATDLIC